MSAKEIKTALKEARDAVKSKDFKLAIKKCAEVLKQDKENYMALILLGAAHQDTNKPEAAKFLRRALSSSADHLLALQGLMNCAEVDELPAIYGELLNLQPERCTEFHNKILGFYKDLKNVDNLIKVLEAETKLDPTHENRIYSAWKTLVQILMEVETENYLDLFEEALGKTVKDVQVNRHSDRYRKLITILYKKNKLTELVEAASSMNEMYSKDSFPIEWICKIYGDGAEVKALHSIEIYIERLLDMNPKSSIGLLAKAVHAYNDQDLIGARDILLIVYESEPTWTRCQQLLFDIYYQLRAFSSAEFIYDQLKTKETDLRVVKVLVQQEKATAIEICKTLLVNSASLSEQIVILVWFTKALIVSGQKDAASKTIGKLESMQAESCVITLLKALLDEQLDFDVISALNDTDLLIDAGSLFVKQQQFDKALTLFLKSAKTCPTNSEAFYWLGKTYHSVGSEDRSVKCLEKCLHLNFQNEKAVHILSTIYRKNQNWDSNLTLLQNSVKFAHGSESKWAYYQLGLHYLATREYNKAVDAFRSALRYDSTEVVVYEGLADAYFARGSYKSALKVYERAAPENVYAKLQVANILRILQEFQASLETFEQLLEEDSEYVPALKGLADTHYRLAKHLSGEKRFGRAQIHFQAAVDAMARLINIRPSYGCIWRMFGNILDLVAALPPVYSFINAPGQFVGVSSTTEKVVGKNILELASRCYSRAIKINPNDSFIYYELAANYMARSALSDPEDTVKFRNLAHAAAKYTVKLAPTCWQNWNLLGVICKELDNLAVAQHCFIKALTLDKKCTVPWTNLGLLYLTQGNIRLANKAFGKAQQSDMTFVNAWIGQAMIADQVGEFDEALDLYRHCTGLEFRKEAALGYANSVSTVLDQTKDGQWGDVESRYTYVIKNMHAVTVSLDQITWYCKQLGAEADLEGLCFLGYFCLAKKLYKGAIEAYEAALPKAEKAQKDKILCDLGFAYLKVNEAQKAISAFRQITEACYKSTIGSALACFKAQEFEESYSIYSSALEWLASSDAEKATILVAMAAMVYAFQGENDTKTLLFQCISSENPLPQALFSACALGILHSDTELAQLTSEELAKHEDDPVHGHHAVFLIAQFLIKQGNERGAIIYICQKIHCFPDRPHLRHVLVNILSAQRRSKKFALATSRMAQSVITLGRIDTDNSSERLAKCLAMAAKAVIKIDNKRSRILAQRAIHLNPCCREAWTAFIQSQKV